MDKKYSILFDEVSIGNCVIKNRFAMAPMGPLGLGDFRRWFQSKRN
jgi:hypothetical protein